MCLQFFSKFADNTVYDTNISLKLTLLLLVTDSNVLSHFFSVVLFFALETEPGTLCQASALPMRYTNSPNITVSVLRQCLTKLLRLFLQLSHRACTATVGFEYVISNEKTVSLVMLLYTKDIFFKNILRWFCIGSRHFNL